MAVTISHPQAPLPPTCGVAFKEWSGVCEALGGGRQTFLLRKGGVSEDAGCFRPDHEVFWLAPTYVHEQEQGLKPGNHESSPPAPGFFSIGLLAQVNSIRWIDDEQSLSQISEFHVWTPETIRKRFHYRTLGLWLLDVRIYRRSQPLLVETTPERRGCKTWISLDRAEPTLGLSPVINDDEATRLRSTILSFLTTTG